MMTSSTPTSPTTMKQHTPYGYHAVPEEYRSCSNSPPPFFGTTDSLGAFTLYSDGSVSDFDHHDKRRSSGQQGAFYHQAGVTTGSGGLPQLPPSYQSALNQSSSNCNSPNNSCSTPPGSNNHTTRFQPPPRSIHSFRSTGSSVPSTYSSEPSPTTSTGRPNFRPHPQQQPQYHRMGTGNHNNKSNPRLEEQRRQHADNVESNGATSFLSSSFGSLPSALRPRPNTTFKAHFALEKAGLPYHQFPNGGNLPTPDHWPQHCTIDNNTNYPTYRAFIGQVRFETTTEQIAWVLETVAGIRAAFVAYHRNGCFVVHFFTQQECEIAVNHHKKVLFDLNGVWDVSGASNCKALGQVLKNRANLHKHRLPRGCMVIEQFANANIRNQGHVPNFPPSTKPATTCGSKDSPRCSSILFTESATDEEVEGGTEQPSSSEELSLEEPPRVVDMIPKVEA